MADTVSFQDRLNGRFSGVLAWSDLEALWQRVQGVGKPWFWYQVGMDVPEQPITEELLADSIQSLHALLKQDHDYDYCGIVYVDDPAEPTLIKVYDPNNLGASCGSSGQRIPPRWILSLEPPQLIEDDAPTPNNRRRWWKKLFG